MADFSKLEDVLPARLPSLTERPQTPHQRHHMCLRQHLALVGVRIIAHERLQHSLMR